MAEAETVTGERPPLTLSQDQMQNACPTVGPKTQMAMIGRAVYVKHAGEWLLLDADRHGYPPLGHGS
jgi:hypothetical protein